MIICLPLCQSQKHLKPDHSQKFIPDIMYTTRFLRVQATFKTIVNVITHSTINSDNLGFCLLEGHM